MKRIFYGVNGEGLGHASRTLAIIQQLPEHEIHVFTYGQALQMFKGLNYPHLHEINGLRFSYKNGRVSYSDTAFEAFIFWMEHLRGNIQKIRAMARKLRPSLFVSDFEPSVPRAANGTPLVSLDNQHRFAYTDMLRLPWKLRMYGWGVGLLAKWMVPNPDHTIISTFHWDKLKIKRDAVTLTNGLLRKEVEATEPTDEGYVLVYIRESVADRVLRAIRDLPHQFKVFGARGRNVLGMTDRPNIEFHPISPAFVDYLANCTCVISTAGNQLLTEARFWRKPVLILPEPGQHEQAINANYAQYLNMGRTYDVAKLTAPDVDDFINKCRHCCYARYEPHVVNGTNTAVEVLKRYL
jgi:uncharacterized protein (TIGR00661 family)